MNTPDPQPTESPRSEPSVAETQSSPPFVSIALWSLRIPMATIVSINLLFLFASFAMPSDRERRSIDGSTYLSTTQAALKMAQIITNLLGFVYCFWNHPRPRATPAQRRQMAAIGLLALYGYFVMLGAYRLRGQLDKTSQILEWVQEVMNVLMIGILVLELRLQRQLQERQIQAQEVLERTPTVVYYQPNMSHVVFGGDELPKYEERDEEVPVVIDMANLSRAQSDSSSLAHEVILRVPERVFREPAEQTPPQTSRPPDYA
ncbi:MAG: hypothetical protein BYD32DRAFT_402669 [Podila humilis]|nr:MAG: hypothetical protein BYD32DRAFT_402669 [Podila humilis]